MAFPAPEFIPVPEGMPMPMDLAEEHTANYPLGVAWLALIFLMFFAQHHVCDAYFVPAINVFIDKMRKSDKWWVNRWGEEAVAGATICALGCNGPELASNLISLYTCSDAGIGVVVGSEIFNLLIICGAATLASPLSPLPLEKVPFTRDCIFYFVSIILLAVFLADSAVQWYEAVILLSLALVFVGTVFSTSDLVNCIPALRPPPVEEKTGGADEAGKSKFHGIDVEVKEIYHARIADGSAESYHGEMAAKGIGMMLTSDEPEETAEANKRGSYGFSPLMGGPMLLYKDLTEVAIVAEGALRLEFPKKMKTIVIKCETIDARRELQNRILENDSAVWVHKYDPTVVDSFNHLYHVWCDKKNYGLVAKIVSVPEFIVDVILKSTLFFVDVKDVNKENRFVGCFCGAMFWLATFSYLMLEIADQVHDCIPELSTAFLGITVCAVGTSLPNAFASVIMAQQGKPGAAIANALGSNVQNVFLAMALPWCIYMVAPAKDCEATAKAAKLGLPPVMATVGQDLVMGAEGLNEGVIWMLLTLAVLIVFVLLPQFCSLSKVYGGILCMLYIVYVIETSCKVFGVLPSEKLFGVLNIKA
mmetsp:Transcript_33104/g.58919  ORF Transcript_33104/g.58919 Transcript_33104/m.58919 type:complete len:590 (+) Transcript_33104:71-1840(+)